VPSRFELRLTTAYEALADGKQVQISAQLLETYGDEGCGGCVAARARAQYPAPSRAARSARRGLRHAFGAGRQCRLFPQTELEADILSISLLANAGYDPELAPAFWRRFGPEHSSGPFHSPTHPDWRDRVATMEREIAMCGRSRSSGSRGRFSRPRSAARRRLEKAHRAPRRATSRRGGGLRPCRRPRLIGPDAARVIDQLGGALVERHRLEHVMVDQHDEHRAGLDRVSISTSRAPSGKCLGQRLGMRLDDADALAIAPRQRAATLSAGLSRKVVDIGLEGEAKAGNRRAGQRIDQRLGAGEWCARPWRR
jgi:hypothetical protein